MTHQINLYDPALRRRRERLTLPNLAVAMAVVAVAIVGWGIRERSRLGTLEEEAKIVAGEAKAMQDELAALAGRKATAADAQAEAELAAARGLLAERVELLDVLKRGTASGRGGFADSLRALARQTPKDLWLTGFAIAAGDGGAEIRGRMTEPALLPEFVRRLNAEAAFAGRSFAALQVEAGKPTAAGLAPPYHEFALVPKMPKDKP